LPVRLAPEGLIAKDLFLGAMQQLRHLILSATFAAAYRRRTGRRNDVLVALLTYRRPADVMLDPDLRRLEAIALAGLVAEALERVRWMSIATPPAPAGKP